MVRLEYGRYSDSGWDIERRSIPQHLVDRFGNPYEIFGKFVPTSITWQSRTYTIKSFRVDGIIAPLGTTVNDPNIFNIIWERDHWELFPVPGDITIQWITAWGDAHDRSTGWGAPHDRWPTGWGAPQRAADETWWRNHGEDFLER
jgi:hypothetical protein